MCGKLKHCFKKGHALKPSCEYFKVQMAVIPIQNYFNAELRFLKFINNSSRFYPGMFFIASPDVEDRMKQLVDEKEQMLNVISDKTKENRHLKDELHKMVDVIAAEKNALSKVSAALTNLSTYEFPFCLFFVFVLHKILQIQSKFCEMRLTCFLAFVFLIMLVTQPNCIKMYETLIFQVQEENQALISKYEGFDREMNRETVARLSKLISEKDLEIESLKQKCQTLLDVLHQQEQRQGISDNIFDCSSWALS